MINWIATLLGFILHFIYKLVENYGVAIILFTVVVKLIILPLNLKSQRSMAKSQKLAPLIAELQKKYANDQQKLNREMMELYKANGASPTAGCLPLLIQFPIIIGLYRAIQSPIHFISSLPSFVKGSPLTGELTNAIREIVDKNQGMFNESIIKGVQSANPEIAISRIADNPLFSSLNIADWKINYNFLGMDLSRNPSEALNAMFNGGMVEWSVILLLLIPVLAGVSSWLITKLNPQQQQMQSAADANGNEQPNMGKMMTMMMPLMSVFFTFSFAAGIGVYWIISNVFQMIQQYFTVKYFKSKEDETSVVNTIKPNRKNSKKH